MPAKKVSSSALLRKHLGKKSGDELLRKISQMHAAGASFQKIEKAVSQHLAHHIQQQIASAVKPLISLVRPLSVKSVPPNISKSIISKSKPMAISKSGSNQVPQVKPGRK